MKEAIQHYNAVVAACLFLAYQDLSSQRNVDIQNKVFAAPRIPTNSGGGTGGSDTFLDPNSIILPAPNPSDPAECCLSDVPIAKWNLEQVGRLTNVVVCIYSAHVTID